MARVQEEGETKNKRRVKKPTYLEDYMTWGHCGKKNLGIRSPILLVVYEFSEPKHAKQILLLEYSYNKFYTNSILGISI